MRYGVRASLPYFIPVPLPPIGTFGAVIFMEPRQGDRKAVFDIGISGPLAGLVPTFLFLIVGLFLSQTAEAPPGDHFILGIPLVMQYLVNLIKGPLPHGFEVMWHPLAFAGWVGLFITSLNLIPAGQLDGGHILYAISPRLHRRLTYVLPFVLFLCGLFFWVGWLLWGLILFIPAMRHPRVPIDQPLDPKRLFLSLLTLAIFILTFSVAPFSGNSILHYIR